MTPAAVVLAAGSSSRMAGGLKLVETLEGVPIVACAVWAALEARCDPVVVVVGHRADEVRAALPGGALVVDNPAFRDGLSTSLARGLTALPDGVEAAFVALGDMPRVRAEHYRALAGAWRPGAIVAPTRSGRRGHPVLWSARWFVEMCATTGDRGARELMSGHAEDVIEVPVADDGVLFDIDDVADLRRARRESMSAAGGTRGRAP